jgi:hypothetical protein
MHDRENSARVRSASVGAGPFRGGDAAEVVAPVAALVGVRPPENHGQPDRESAKGFSTQSEHGKNDFFLQTRCEFTCQLHRQKHSLVVETLKYSRNIILK